MNKTKSLQPVVIIAAIIALLAGLWLGFVTDSKPPAPPEIIGTVLPAGKALGRFVLIDQTNHAFTEKNLIGHWSLIFIGYTHCPDVCPTTLSTLQQTVGLMQEQQIPVPKVVFISIDPERDTPDVLAKYIEYFNKNFIAATGADEQLGNISGQLSAFYGKAAGVSGDINNADYLMDHTASLILINPRAEIQAFLTGPHFPEQVLESVRRTVQYYDETH